MSNAVTQPRLLSPITEDELGQLQLQLPALKVISLFGPGASGGVSTSLEPVVRQLGTKVHWIALSGLPIAETNASPGFSFYRPNIPEQLLKLNVDFANDYLWPLFHGMPEKAIFDPEDWKSLRQLSQYVASETLRVSSGSFPTICWLHDFHMVLVGPLLAMEAGTILCHFWHVPWPEPEVMTRSPVVRELTESLLVNKIIGFHTTEYATNFLNTVQEVVPGAVVDPLKMEVKVRGNKTRIVVMPLGLDFNYWQNLARQARPRAAALPKKYRLANQIILGVDRLDYTKGILERLQALDIFLTENPGWLRRFHYVQLTQMPPSQGLYARDYTHKTKDMVEELNRKYKSDGWEPILWLDELVSHEELAAWYLAADVLTVTPAKDGLNLIAKEFAACRLDEQGALVLSRQAGCASELSTGAIMVDGTNQSEIAASIKSALAMEAEEKRRRMVTLRHVVGWNQLHDWALGFLRETTT